MCLQKNKKVVRCSKYIELQTLNSFIVLLLVIVATLSRYKTRLNRYLCYGCVVQNIACLQNSYDVKIALPISFITCLKEFQNRTGTNN